MDLTELIVKPQQSFRRDSDSFTLAAGKTLKIEWSPGGTELLNATVPDGKEWHVQIDVRVEEDTPSP